MQITVWASTWKEQLQRCWLDASGKVVLRRRLQRDGASTAMGLPGCVDAMEACCGAHHLGRRTA